MPRAASAGTQDGGHRGRETQARTARDAGLRCEARDAPGRPSVARDAHRWGVPRPVKEGPAGEGGPRAARDGTALRAARAARPPIGEVRRR